MATRRVRLNVTINAEVDETAAKAHLLSLDPENPPDSDVSRETLDTTLMDMTSSLEATLMILLFNAGPWDALADAVPSMKIDPGAVEIRVEALDD